jgi:hypothetical protein
LAWLLPFPLLLQPRAAPPRPKAGPTNARPMLARWRVRRLAQPGPCVVPRAAPPAAPSAARSPVMPVGVQALARPSAPASAPYDVPASATRCINGTSMNACVGRERERTPNRQSLHCRTANCLAYSITSSARAISDGGTVRPSDFAALRLITRSNLVGNCTGKAAALVPLRIFPA